MRHIFLIVFFSSAVAMAQASGDIAAYVSPPVPKVIMLVDKTPGDIATAVSPEMLEVAKAVKGQLSDLSVEFIVEIVDEISVNLPSGVKTARKISEKTGALAVFWCDLNLTDEVYFYLADSKQRRILVRRLDEKGQGDPVESLAIIARSAIEAMLMGGEIGIKVESVKSKTLVTKTKKTDFLIALGYLMGMHSSNHPLVHGVDIETQIVFPAGMFINAGYVFRWPYEINNKDINLEIQSWPLSLGLGYLAEFRRFISGFKLDFMMDFVSHKTTKISSITAVPKDNFNVIISINPIITGSLEITKRIRFRIGAGVRFILNPIRYVTDTGSSHVELDKPFSVSPIATALFVFVI